MTAAAATGVARGERGFTLIESLVALAILAFASVSLLAATEAHVARIGGLETRALAQIAAENHLAELELGLAEGEAEASLLGHAFEIAAERSPTADPDLARIDLTVTDAASGAAFRGFTGFVDTGAPQSNPDAGATP